MSETVEFASKAAADAIREEYPDALCSDDDRRLKTVRFRDDVDEDVLDEAHLTADIDAGEQASKVGQAKIGSAKGEFDFSREGVNIPKLRAIKAIAIDKGIDDWVSYFDPTLSVDEHREVFSSVDARSGGKRMDSEDNAVKRAGQAAEVMQDEKCDHAEGHCKHGDPEACEFLTERCGFSDEQVERILDDSEGDPASGDLPGPVYHGLSSQWTQFKAGLGETRRAAAAINEIREQYGQDPISFDALGGETVTKEDLNA